MADNRTVGTLVEKKACEYLAHEGYEIVDNNYRGPSGEIDIVARKGDTLVFVEVKGRKQGSLEYGWGVDREKQRRIIETSRRFLYKKGIGDRFFVRYDIVAVNLTERTLEHWQNAFTETGTV